MEGGSDIEQKARFLRAKISATLLLVAGSFGAQAATVERDPMNDMQVVAAQPVVELDPIVTGRKVTEAQLRDWEARREIYRLCEACVESQPYPGDIKTD